MYFRAEILQNFRFIFGKLMLSYIHSDLIWPLAREIVQKQLFWLTFSSFFQLWINENSEFVIGSCELCKEVIVDVKEQDRIQMDLFS